MIEIVENQFQIDEKFYTDKLALVIQQLNLDPEGEIVIKIGEKEEALTLNRQYLNRDYPADVLSFPSNEELPDGYYIGDIFICYPVAEEQARENNVSIQKELLRLMVHGILHLAGYDHETDTGEMLVLQEQIIAQHMNLQ